MKKVIAFLLLCTMALMLVGCKKEEKEGALTKVVLNEVAHSYFYAPMYVAIELGFFEEEGIDLTLVNGSGADNTMTALISGEADIGFMGSEQSIFVTNEGMSDQVVNFAQLTQRAGNFLVARENLSDFKWEDLKGSYAIQVLSKDLPDNMIVARKDSPLVIGKGDGENYISSDIPAILSFTKYFYFLDDNEIALLSRNNIEFYDINLNKLSKKVKSIDWNASAADKNGYEDYMLKEIYEQPNAIRETIGSRLPENESCNFEDLNFNKEFLSKINKVYIVACGTAMHAGLSGKVAIEKLCNIPVTVDIASEFRYRNPIIDENTLCIYISQSGETADTIAALKLSKSKGATTLAVTNVIGSSITREADYSIYTHAGPEIAVASTKAYTSQVILLDILALYFAEILETTSTEEINDLKQEILALPSKIEDSLKCSKEIKKFAKKIYQEKDVFFLGRGSDYNTALEGSLKLKEISYIHSEAYAAGELKHGPIALIENGINVISIITDEFLIEKTISNIQEVITRGAHTLVVTNKTLPTNNIDKIITVPDTNIFLSPIISIVPLQLLSYYISKEIKCLGINMNFAPTVDLFTNFDSTIIGTRSFGSDPEKSGILGAAFAAGSEAAGVIPTVKHFPGHGDTELDSHGKLPIIDIDFETFTTRELVPFNYLIQHGVSALMNGHLSFPQIDSTGAPASLSKYFLTQLLRNQLGYKGLIITDDMMMVGATSYAGSLSEAFKMAIEAGNDIILSSTTAKLNEALWTKNLDRMSSDQAFYKRVKDAARRVIKAKLDYFKSGNAAPLYPDPTTIDSFVPDKEGQKFFLEQACRSITIEKKGNIPYTKDNSGRILLVGSLESFFKDGKKRYPESGEFRFSYETGPNETQWVIDNLPGVAKNYDTIILCVSSENHVKIANIFKNSGKKVIILNTRSPILAEPLSWADCVLIGYSWRCEYSLNAMLGVINGEFEAEGTKPY